MDKPATIDDERHQRKLKAAIARMRLEPMEPVPTLPPGTLPANLPQAHREAMKRAGPAEVSALRREQFALLEKSTRPEQGFWDYVEIVMASSEFKVFVNAAKLAAAEALLIAGEIAFLALMRKAGLDVDDGGTV